MRHGISLAILLGLAGATGLAEAKPPAHAREGRHWRPPRAMPAVTVSLADGHGMALSTIHHRGRDFVVGDRGERYEIHLRNNTASRMEVVVTVDGLDVVSGRPGDFTRQRGYVLAPFGTAVIDGFRTSLRTVAAFRFSAVGDSFAAKTGSASNAGVIGIAAFKERAPMMVRPHGGTTKSARSRDKSARPSAPGSSAPSTESWGGRSQQLGTEFAEERMSAVREVSFVRANARLPDFRTTLQYDSARGLAARGVPVAPEPVMVEPRPADAWPGAQGGRFAQPPPGWRRHARR